MFHRSLLFLCFLCCACREDAPLGKPRVFDDEELAKSQMAQEADIRRTMGGRFRYHPELRTVAVVDSLNVSFSSSVTVGTSLIRFAIRYPSLFGSRRSSEFDAADSVTEKDGSQHVVLQQRLEDVSLWGCVLSGHVAPDRKLLRILARTVPLQNFRAEAEKPTHTQEEARQQTLRLLAQQSPQVAWSALTPKLYFLPLFVTQNGLGTPEKKLALVYRIEVSGQDGDLPLRQAWFVSAHDLSVIASEDLVVASDVPVPAFGKGIGVLGETRDLSVTLRGETYSMEDLRRGGSRTTATNEAERLPGKTVQSANSDVWESSHAVSTHAHLASLWDYFSTMHQRFGWDGKGRGMLAVVHADLRSVPLPVALFDGQRMVLGFGEPGTLLPAGGALDVVAHEYAHAVIRSTANLAAEGEAGVLDEGIANVFACLVEQAILGKQANWTLGETIYRRKDGFSALADLEHPANTNQATTFSDSPVLAADLQPSLSLLNRSLRRYRAGYVGHAGFLIAQRIGHEETAAILFRAVSLYLHRYSDATDLADAMIAAARDLYGADADSVRAIRTAWETVGVRNFLP